jgi:hypothetical protein
VAAWDPERLRVELEAAGPLRAEGAFELRPAEPAFELLRAAEFELLRAAEFELLRAAEFELLRAAEFELLRAEPELELRRLELAAVAPLPLAAGRPRSLGFADPLCFVLVCLATSHPLYGRCNEAQLPCNIDCGGPHIGGVDSRPLPTTSNWKPIRRTPRGDAPRKRLGRFRERGPLRARARSDGGLGRSRRGPYRRPLCWGRAAKGERRQGEGGVVTAAIQGDRSSGSAYMRLFSRVGVTATGEVVIERAPLTGRAASTQSG